MLQEAQAEKFDLWKEGKAGTSVILATLLRQPRVTKNGAWREHCKQGGWWNSYVIVLAAGHINPSDSALSATAGVQSCAHQLSGAF